jgi:diguanylate cyclase
VNSGIPFALIVCPADQRACIAMTLLIDLISLLLAAIGGACAMWLVLWLRSAPPSVPRVAPVAEPQSDEEEAHFARETLSRLQALTKQVALEVDQHTECVEEINAQLAKTDENDESAVLAAVAQLIEANGRMQRELDTAEVRLQDQARQIKSHAVEARTDALTQVANRRALDDELARCVSDFTSRGTPSTIMLLDVDHFKRFNDTHGHQAGDEVLQSVARVVRQTTGEVGLVARYGGEEFAVIFAGLDAASAIPYCERARQAIGDATVKVAGRELRVTASAGVADVRAGESEKELIGRADEALYSSKKAGRNCGHQHDGRICRLIRLQDTPAAAAAGSPVVTEQVGDEWLFESEMPTAAIFHESLPNVDSRPAFFDDLIRRLAQWRRGGTPLTLLLVQVDAYARIVGDHGPDAGEVVLRVTSQLINASMREMDHVARLGEETFAVLLPGFLLRDGLTVGQRLRQAVERCRLPRKAKTSWFTVSVGVVEANDGDDLRRILRRARGALTAAVNQGRNCVVGRDTLGAQLREQRTPTAALAR